MVVVGLGRLVVLVLLSRLLSDFEKPFCWRRRDAQIFLEGYALMDTSRII